MKIANNIVGMQVTNYMRKTDSKLTTSMQRLSSGLKINSVKDDAAGLAVANKLERQYQGTDRASMNAMDGVSLIQTADGALSQIHDMLQRMRELSVSAANDSMTDSDRRKVNDEITNLIEEIDATTYKAEFNKIKLLSGEAQRMAKDSDISVAEVTYVSDAVPPGIIQYNVVSVGTPATSTTSYDPTAVPEGMSGSISINGAKIEILTTDTQADINQKILQACDDTNINADFSGSSAVFTTYEEGSKQSITFSGDTALLTAFGLPTTTVNGTDATVTDIEMFKPDGVTPEPAFNQALAVAVNGNEITLTSTKGQVIEIDAKKTTGGVSTSEITDYGQLVLQVGANKGLELGIYIPKVDSELLDINYVNVSTIPGASNAIASFDDAISKVSTIRATLGAYQNRLEYTTSALDINSINTQQALSRIRDTDMAKEMSLYSQQNVIYQAGVSILAQANQRPQQVLQLLR